MSKANKITFTPLTKFIEEVLEFPSPASTVVPKWYKDLPLYTNKSGLPKYNDESENYDQTLKKCVPVLDSLCVGYVLKTPADILVDFNDNGEQIITWKTPDFDLINKYNGSLQIDFISRHYTEQIGDYPIPVGYSKDVYKFNGFWNIKTPDKYSLLLTHPVSRFDLPFYSMTAIVDSDIFNLTPINIPFFIKKDFRGLIPAGTPYSQVIPILREKWEMEKSSSADAARKQDIFLAKTKLKITSWYKENVWNKKEYK